MIKKEKKEYSKLITVMILTVMCLCMFAGKVRAAEKTFSKSMRLAVVSKTAPAYEKKSTKSKAVKTYNFGDKLVPLGESGNWYKVAKGYIKKSQTVLYDKSKNHIALTFDDGPSSSTTPTVLDALEKYNARATFMVVGKNIGKKTGKLLKREIALGCEIGNHSYTHANLKKSSLSTVKSELKKTDNAVKKYTGKKPTVVRSPYGAFTKKTLAVYGRPHIYWSVDTLDWKYRDTSRLISYVSKHAGDGEIILMHDIHKTTVKAVDSILKNLIKKDYEMVTVTELAAIHGCSYKSGTTYYSLKRK